MEIGIKGLRIVALSLEVTRQPDDTQGRRLKSIAEDVGMDNLFDYARDQVKWVDVPYGKTLIFTPNPLHGNVVNQVPETRWSLNSRFTGLFTPYPSSEKSLGKFYLPITTRVVSRIGMNYRRPEGFSE